MSVIKGFMDIDSKRHTLRLSLDKDIDICYELRRIDISLMCIFFAYLFNVIHKW